MYGFFFLIETHISAIIRHHILILIHELLGL